MHSILLVGDSSLFQGVGERIRQRALCRLLIARDGSEALSVARAENPDIIFADAEMRGMTGIDVCRVLKAESRFAHTPILVAAGSEAAREDARRAGAAGCLAKPFDETAMFDTIRRHLQVSPPQRPRSTLGWPVTFWRDGAQHDGTLRDLSRGGFFIQTAVRQPVGARLEISFEVPGKKPSRTVVAEAIVVRMALEPEPLGLGCRFFRITSGPRVHLEECLRILDSGERRL